MERGKDEEGVLELDELGRGEGVDEDARLDGRRADRKGRDDRVDIRRTAGERNDMLHAKVGASGRSMLCVRKEGGWDFWRRSI